MNGFGERLPIGALRVRDARKLARLMEIRCRDRGERQQTVHERPDRIVQEQLRTRCSHHHRIDDERNRAVGEKLRNRLDDRRAEDHPGLHRVDADVVEDSLELGADELPRNLVHRGDGDRVLRRQCDDRAHSVAAEARERLEIRLDARPSARVGRGNRQAPGHHAA